jgi:hypothetical protein
VCGCVALPACSRRSGAALLYMLRLLRIFTGCDSATPEPLPRCHGLTTEDGCAFADEAWQVLAGSENKKPAMLARGGLRNVQACLSNGRECITTYRACPVLL